MSENEKSVKAKKDSKIAGFFKGVKAEFKKIIWPERDTLLKQLLAVIVVTFLTGLIIAVLDYGFQNLIDFLTQFQLPASTATAVTDTAAEAATAAATIVQ